ncbi:hypothetical protein QYF36_023030 [Acer negundo]|nr:hypothetical protein QYF36_023030 [Acer negundo]
MQHDRMSRNRRRMEEEEEDSMIEEDNFTMKCPEDAEFQKPKIISLWVCSEILWLECVQFLIFYGAMNIITAKLTSFPLQSFHVMIIDRCIAKKVRHKIMLHLSNHTSKSPTGSSERHHQLTSGISHQIF